MKNYTAGFLTCFFLITVLVTACAMGGKSIRKRKKRLIAPIDQSKTPWEFCTPKMIPDYKGKMCLVECELKLKKDGTCKKNKYKYIPKVLKDEHEFFMDKFIAVPEGYYY